MAGLRDAGFVRSQKGHGGGWTIARDLALITLRDVYAALGSPALFALGNRTEAPGCLVEQAVNTALAQLQRYPTLRTMADEAIGASAVVGGFEVKLANGETLTAARLVLAFGISDMLPRVPGLAERWGKSVLHCPYCHGFAYGGQRLGVLQTMAMSAHQALLIADWGPTTLYLNGGDMPDAEGAGEAGASWRGDRTGADRGASRRGHNLVIAHARGRKGSADRSDLPRTALATLQPARRAARLRAG